MRTLLNKGILVCLLLLVISGAAYGFHQLKKWEQEVPNDFIVVKEKGDEKHDKKDFPKDITFHYSMKEHMPVQGKGKTYAFGDINDGGSHNLYAIEQTKKGYRFLTGSKAGYSFEDLSFYGLTSLFAIEETSGAFTVTFTSYKQYQNFLGELNYGENWREAFNYYKEETRTEE